MCALFHCGKGTHVTNFYKEAYTQAVNYKREQLKKSKTDKLL